MMKCSLATASRTIVSRKMVDGAFWEIGGAAGIYEKI